MTDGVGAAHRFAGCTGQRSAEGVGPENTAATAVGLQRVAQGRIGLAIHLCLPGAHRHRDRPRRDRQAAVDIGDRVVAGIEGAAGGGTRCDRVRATRHIGAGCCSTAGEGDAADGLAVDQATGGEGGARQAQGLAINLARVVGRDGRCDPGDGGSHRGWEGQCVVARCCSGQAQTAVGDCVGTGHIRAVVSGHRGAGDRQCVACEGLAIRCSSRASRLGSQQCGGTADHGLVVAVVVSAGGHGQPAEGQGLGCDGGCRRRLNHQRVIGRVRTRQAQATVSDRVGGGRVLGVVGASGSAGDGHHISRVANPVGRGA